MDCADRDQVLKVLDVIPASIIKDGKITKHNSGVYPTDIPTDPFYGAALDYTDAENRGYVKLDLLNVNLYKQVRDEAHLVELMKEPDWTKLYDAEICGKLTQVNNHYETLLKMPEKVDSIPRLAMFLAVIRPAKKHLIGLTWKEVAKTIWDQPDDGGYFYKKSHAISYSHLVVVNLNLLCGQE